MFKHWKISHKPIVIATIFLISLFLLYDLSKNESYVVRDIDYVDDQAVFTLQSNQWIHPSARKMLITVDQHTTIMDKEGNESEIEEGMKVMIEYTIATLSDPPIAKANKVMTLSSN